MCEEIAILQQEEEMALAVKALDREWYWLKPPAAGDVRNMTQVVAQFRRYEDDGYGNCLVCDFEERELCQSAAEELIWEVGAELDGDDEDPLTISSDWLALVVDTNNLWFYSPSSIASAARYLSALDREEEAAHVAGG